MNIKVDLNVIFLFIWLNILKNGKYITKVLYKKLLIFPTT